MAAVDPRDDPASVVAAQRVLLELWTILAGFADAMTIVGGSAPPLLTGDQLDDPYVGTLDVDLVIDPIGVLDDVYRTIAELLRERGYVQLDQPFRWLRSVTVEGRPIDVEVDLLAPVTPRGGSGHRHERIGGSRLVPPTGSPWTRSTARSWSRPTRSSRTTSTTSPTRSAASARTRSPAMSRATTRPA